MRFLIALVCCIVLIGILAKPLKRHPVPFYIVALALVGLYWFGTTTNTAGGMWPYFMPLMQRCALAFVLFTIVIGTMAIPQQLSIVPLYIMANKAGLFGSIWAVSIPGLVSAFGVFWMTQYLQDALPYELIEAARVDGCSMFRTFISVAVPAARPAAAMLFLFTFIAQWTNYFWPMLILGPNKNSMLTVAAATLKGAYFTDYTIVMAGVVLTTFPLILLFAVAGKQLVSGIMAGAVKG